MFNIPKAFWNMDHNLNISKNQLDVCESMDVENEMLSSSDADKIEKPIERELMDALQLTANANDCQSLTYSKEYYSCECQGDGNADHKELPQLEVITNEEVIITSNNSEKGDYGTVKDSCNAGVIPAGVEDEKSNQSLLTTSNDVNLITQSYYITIDDQTGEQYAILTLDRASSDIQEKKPIKDEAICFSNESENELKDVGITCDQQSHSQQLSPIPNLQTQNKVPSNGQSLLCSPRYHSGACMGPQFHRSQDCMSQESKLLQPYCERPLQSSTPYNSNMLPSRMSGSSCYSSYNSINLNSGGEETTSSSDNSSLVIPRVPQNTPENNASMTSQMPPPLSVPLTQSVFESPSLTSPNNESICLKGFRMRPRPGILPSCPKEIHNEKERFRRGRIKKACLMLRETVPGLTDKTDKATVLETTVRYICHLKKNAAQEADQEFLEKSFQF